MITGAQIRAARALLRWSADELAKRSNLGRATIVRAEQVDDAPALTKSNLDVLRRTLMEAGIVFIEADGNEGEGVRFQTRRENSPR